MSQYYEYKKQDYFCRKCRWEGIGGQTEEGEMARCYFEIICPGCGILLDIVMFPTIDEILSYGTESEKASARKKKLSTDRVNASRLQDSDQLPEIDSNEFVITLREEFVDGKEGEIVLYWNETEIWRELITYEYYDRYIELGRILKEKYGSRVIDFEAEPTIYLLGDYFPALDEVERFREYFRSNRNPCP